MLVMLSVLMQSSQALRCYHCEYENCDEPTAETATCTGDLCWTSVTSAGALITCAKNWGDRGCSGQILNPNEHDLTFRVSSYGAKFRQNRMKSDSVGTRSSAVAGRPCDAKACQGLLKWTWK